MLEITDFCRERCANGLRLDGASRSTQSRRHGEEGEGRGELTVSVSRVGEGSH